MCNVNFEVNEDTAKAFKSLSPIQNSHSRKFNVPLYNSTINGIVVAGP